MDRYERLERIDHKSARDVVTEADHLSEALIIDAIRERHPTDAILAEESGEHRAIAGEAPTSGRGRLWIIDPLDGTVNYANGIPFFCVSIGLVVDGRPSVGVVHDPTRGETFAATADGPAMLTAALGSPSHAIAASEKDKVSDFVVSMALSGKSAVGRSRAVRRVIRISRSMGSAALALSYVGNGRFDAFVQQGGLSAWDVAAAGLIAERGGAIGDVDGRRPVVRSRAQAAIDRHPGGAGRASRDAARARAVAMLAASGLDLRQDARRRRSRLPGSRG